MVWHLWEAKNLIDLRLNEEALFVFLQIIYIVKVDWH